MNPIEKLQNHLITSGSQSLRSSFTSSKYKGVTFMGYLFELVKIDLSDYLLQLKVNGDRSYKTSLDQVVTIVSHVEEILIPSLRSELEKRADSDKVVYLDTPNGVSKPSEYIVESDGVMTNVEYVEYFEEQLGDLLGMLMDLLESHGIKLGIELKRFLPKNHDKGNLNYEDSLKELKKGKYVHLSVTTDQYRNLFEEVEGLKFEPLHWMKSKKALKSFLQALSNARLIDDKDFFQAYQKHFIYQRSQSGAIVQLTMKDFTDISHIEGDADEIPNKAVKALTQ